MDNTKPILALETSADICSVCVYFNASKYFELSVNLKHSHAEKLFGLLNTVIELSGIPLQFYNAVAVSAGPGSFTGLRIGFSAAKAIALGGGLPLISVPTFEAMAFDLLKYLPEGTKFAIANKVNKDEIYFVVFHVKANNYIFAENLQIVKSADFIQKSTDLLVFGNANTGKTAEITAPPAKAVAGWALQYGTPVTDFDFIEPNYMKNFIIKEKQK